MSNSQMTTGYIQDNCAEKAAQATEGEIIAVDIVSKRRVSFDEGKTTVFETEPIDWDEDLSELEAEGKKLSENDHVDSFGYYCSPEYKLYQQLVERNTYFNEYIGREHEMKKTFNLPKSPEEIIATCTYHAYVAIKKKEKEEADARNKKLEVLSNKAIKPTSAASYSRIDASDSVIEHKINPADIQESSKTSCGADITVSNSLSQSDITTDHNELSDVTMMNSDNKKIGLNDNNYPEINIHPSLNNNYSLINVVNSANDQQTEDSNSATCKYFSADENSFVAAEVSKKDIEECKSNQNSESSEVFEENIDKMDPNAEFVLDVFDSSLNEYYVGDITHVNNTDEYIDDTTVFEKLNLEEAILKESTEYLYEHNTNAEYEKSSLYRLQSVEVVDKSNIKRIFDASSSIEDLFSISKNNHETQDASEINDQCDSQFDNEFVWKSDSPCDRQSEVPSDSKSYGQSSSLCDSKSDSYQTKGIVKNAFIDDNKEKESINIISINDNTLEENVNLSSTVTVEGMIAMDNTDDILMNNEINENIETTDSPSSLESNTLLAETETDISIKNLHVCDVESKPEFEILENEGCVGNLDIVENPLKEQPHETTESDDTSLNTSLAISETNLPLKSISDDKAEDIKENECETIKQITEKVTLSETLKEFENDQDNTIICEPKKLSIAERIRMFNSLNNQPDVLSKKEEREKSSESESSLEDRKPCINQLGNLDSKYVDNQKVNSLDISSNTGEKTDEITELKSNDRYETANKEEANSPDCMSLSDRIKFFKQLEESKVKQQSIVHDSMTKDIKSTVKVPFTTKNNVVEPKLDLEIKQDIIFEENPLPVSELSDCCKESKVSSEKRLDDQPCNTVTEPLNVTSNKKDEVDNHKEKSIENSPMKKVSSVQEPCKNNLNAKSSAIKNSCKPNSLNGDTVKDTANKKSFDKFRNSVEQETLLLRLKEQRAIIQKKRLNGKLTYDDLLCEETGLEVKEYEGNKEACSEKCSCSRIKNLFLHPNCSNKSTPCLFKCSYFDLYPCQCNPTLNTTLAICPCISPVEPCDKCYYIKMYRIFLLLRFVDLFLYEKDLSQYLNSENTSDSEAKRFYNWCSDSEPKGQFYSTALEFYNILASDLMEATKQSNIKDLYEYCYKRYPSANKEILPLPRILKDFMKDSKKAFISNVDTIKKVYSIDKCVSSLNLSLSDIRLIAEKNDLKDSTTTDDIPLPRDVCVSDIVDLLLFEQEKERKSLFNYFYLLYLYVGESITLTCPETLRFISYTGGYSQNLSLEEKRERFNRIGKLDEGLLGKSIGFFKQFIFSNKNQRQDNAEMFIEGLKERIQKEAREKAAAEFESNGNIAILRTHLKTRILREVPLPVETNTTNKTLNSKASSNASHIKSPPKSTNTEQSNIATKIDKSIIESINSKIAIKALIKDNDKATKTDKSIIESINSKIAIKALIKENEIQEDSINSPLDIRNRETVDNLNLNNDSKVLDSALADKKITNQIDLTTVKVPSKDKVAANSNNKIHRVVESLKPLQMKLENLLLEKSSNNQPEDKSKSPQITETLPSIKNNPFVLKDINNKLECNE